MNCSPAKSVATATSVIVRPELVVEIAFNDIQESPQYPGRLALRFARVKRYRYDKRAAEADTFESSPHAVYGGPQVWSRPSDKSGRRGPRPTSMLRAFGVTDRGRIRPTNEDCFGIDPALELCVVADGMGGHNAGEVASRIAVEAVLDYVANNAVTTTWPYGYDDVVSERGQPASHRGAGGEHAGLRGRGRVACATPAWGRRSSPRS